MKRIKLVLAVGVVMAALLALNAGSAMADVEDRLDERADRIEERLENSGFDVDVDEEDLLYWYDDIDFVYNIDDIDDGVVFLVD
jgi:ribosome assembly protein YihI (activator of Der GTPase)